MIELGGNVRRRSGLVEQAEHLLGVIARLLQQRQLSCLIVHPCFRHFALQIRYWETKVRR